MLPLAAHCLPAQFPLALAQFGHRFKLDPRFNFLVEGYSSQFHWWEAVILLRKFLLSCVPVLVRSPEVQGLLGVAILFACTTAQSLYVLPPLAHTCYSVWLRMSQ